MIAIFGASVTNQKTGYAIKLKNELSEPIQIFGYGGMHLYNAGVCYIDKVVNIAPKYCFIDWFSTAYLEMNKNTTDYIDALIFKLTNINCKVIFLFFLHENHDDRIEFYEYCKSYLDKKNTTYFDLNDYLSYSPDLLRDYVHTTELGSIKYSNVINQLFGERRDTIRLASNVHKNQYCNIQKIDLNNAYSTGFRIKGEAHIIGFLMTIGPHSGIVKITTNGETNSFNTWDQWCYYYRKHFSISFKLKDIANIKISNEEFDTSFCKNIDYNFKEEKKKIILHAIYYIGTLNIESSTIENMISKIKFKHWKTMSKKRELTKRSKKGIKRILK